MLKKLAIVLVIGVVAYLAYKHYVKKKKSGIIDEIIANAGDNFDASRENLMARTVEELESILNEVKASE